MGGRPPRLLLTWVFLWLSMTLFRSLPRCSVTRYRRRLAVVPESGALRVGSVRCPVVGRSTAGVTGEPLR